MSVEGLMRNGNFRQRGGDGKDKFQQNAGEDYRAKKTSKFVAGKFKFLCSLVVSTCVTTGPLGV